MAGLQGVQEILVEMLEDLGRMAGAESRPTGVAEVMATIASPFIALALLLLIVVVVLGRGLGRQESSSQWPVVSGQKKN